MAGLLLATAGFVVEESRSLSGGAMADVPMIMTIIGTVMRVSGIILAVIAGSYRRREWRAAR